MASTNCKMQPLRPFLLKKQFYASCGQLVGIARRGTIAKIHAPSGTSIRAQQQVDQCGHVTDVDAAVTIDIGSL